GILSDLIGDLTWSPNPVEVKVFSTEPETLKSAATRIAKEIEGIPGIVDINDGLVVAGPSLIFRVRAVEAVRAGLTAEDVGSELETALEGGAVSSILEGDRILDVRVLVAGARQSPESAMGLLPIQAKNGVEIALDNVASIEHEAGLLEVQREDQRELVAVSARLSGRDLRSGVDAIRKKLAASFETPRGASIEYGGLYKQQQESFHNLTIVLLMAILLVFGVLTFEFNTLFHPIAIVAGAVLALFGVIGALWITGTSLNIVSFLSAIIGFGIVAKNGILMLDFVGQLQRRGFTLVESLVQSGRRRLRPVLMTSLTAFLGLLPLAYGVGAGADMLRPLAIGVIGALAISLMLSLVATPVVYYLLVRFLGHEQE
ncbi:MAG: efflux RND transporter permease subunit, partial [Candidatus Hydrogenedentes bacterium]|nr:efflux RND transporter permease subunit [Candidatus Hydrogenedentota bacterium]